MKQKTGIYLNYLSDDERKRMTDELSFLKKHDKESKKNLIEIADLIYGPNVTFNLLFDNGHSPTEFRCRSYDKQRHFYTSIQFKPGHLTEDVFKALGEDCSDESDWRYFYAISVCEEDRKLYLVSYANACSPNWLHEYNLKNAVALEYVDFPILKKIGVVYRMDDALHAAINDKLWSEESTFSTSNNGISMVIKDQHGNYKRIENNTLEGLFRDYVNNYTGYRNFRRQMFSEWEIVNEKALESFNEWKKTAKGLKSDFDKFYGGGIVD